MAKQILAPSKHKPIWVLNRSTGLVTKVANEGLIKKVLRSKKYEELTEAEAKKIQAESFQRMRQAQLDSPSPKTDFNAKWLKDNKDYQSAMKGVKFEKTEQSESVEVKYSMEVLSAMTIPQLDELAGEAGVEYKATKKDAIVKEIYEALVGVGSSEKSTFNFKKLKKDEYEELIKELAIDGEFKNNTERAEAIIAALAEKEISVEDFESFEDLKAEIAA